MLEMRLQTTLAVVNLSPIILDNLSAAGVDIRTAHDF